MKKILYYNWVHFNDDEKRGGGVSVYQKNLTDAAIADGWHVDFFSGGLSYAVHTTEPYFERVKQDEPENCRSFQLVNSPVFSPGHSAFGKNDILFEEGELYNKFVEFVAEYGPYDVIHFNNVEGIPFSFLKIKDAYPDTKVVFSHHNYFPICPQVNLWKRETTHCTSFEGGSDCVTCLDFKPNKSEVLSASQIATLLRNRGLGVGSPEFAQAFSSPEIAKFVGNLNKNGDRHEAADETGTAQEQAKSFARRRANSIDILNRYVDYHLAVSSRVRRVLVSYGLREDRTFVSYIGTKHGEAFAHATKRQRPLVSSQLTICFMGYMRRDKGFFFFLEALESLANDVAACVSVKIYARSNGDPATHERIDRLSDRFAHVHYQDGFAHTQLDMMLSDVDLGIVPVLWEDNLPQVALEVVSRGVPILCSDKGGAQELGGSAQFVFQHGDVESFHSALSDIVYGTVPLGAFWDNALPLRTMQQHLDELMEYYDGRVCTHEADSVEDSASTQTDTPSSKHTDTLSVISLTASAHNLHARKTL